MVLDQATELHITLPQEAAENPTLLLARDELTALFRKRFGEGPSLQTLYVRFTLAADEAGAMVSTNGDRLEFRGQTPVQLLYAVYDFAEAQLGYCFFGPGNDLLCSEDKAITLPTGVLLRSGTAPFERRGGIQEFPFSQESFALADWMAKNRLNYLLTWMKHYDTITPELREAFAVRGIEIESGHHNFNYWIPGKTYGASHPEFFAMRNGERIKPTTQEGELLLSEQLCTTNPELRAEITKRMLAYAREHPELKVLSLMPNDGFGWCECERCAELYAPEKKGSLYSVSEHVYDANVIYHDLLADIAGRLRAAGSDLQLTFCAYVNYTKPAPTFRLRKNLSVHFAPYWRCINHEISDPDCWINSGYCKDLTAWRNASDGGGINIYEYLMGTNLYVSLPQISHRSIFHEAADYARMGATGYLTQFQLSHWTAYGINYYMMAKALLGEDRDRSLHDFSRKVFGAQAEKAERFYDKMHALQKSCGPHLVTYPYALFSRTCEADYDEVHTIALELAETAENEFVRSLPRWTEYLLRFKQIFDRYHAGEAGREDIIAFRDWCAPLKDIGVLTFEKLSRLIDAWLLCIDEGREWLHFNIDWEDNYIRRHTHLLS